MEKRERLHATIDEIQWIIDAIEPASRDDVSLRFEKARLDNLHDRLRDLARRPDLVDDDVRSAEVEFFDLLDGNAKLMTAYAAMVSNSIIRYSIKGLRYLTELEQTRALTEIESERKRLYGHIANCSSSTWSESRADPESPWGGHRPPGNTGAGLEVTVLTEHPTKLARWGSLEVTVLTEHPTKLARWGSQSTLQGWQEHPARRPRHCKPDELLRPAAFVAEEVPA